MSLYPYISKYFKLPVVHPVIHMGDACKDNEACLRMDGPIKCSIVPPQMLYQSAVPFRCNKKLMMCFCISCLLNPASGETEHTEDDKRAMTGT